MNKATVLLVLSLFFASSLGFSWTSCGSSGDDFIISNITISPDPPKPGNVSVVAVGTMKKLVTGGSYNVVVKYGFVTVIDDTQDVCSYPVKCPIEVGPFDSALPPLIVPSTAPNGNYKGTAKIADQDGDEVSCVNFEFTMTK